VPSVDSTVEEAKDEEKEEGVVKSEDEFVLDEIAWKKVKGEVFKRPKCSMLLSILVGTGIQILVMVLLLLMFAVIGIVSP
jgi:hypothetical protein